MTDFDPAHAEPASPPLRILLVEDDEFDVAVFGRSFRRSEIACEIVRCRSGEEALEGLRDVELDLDLLVTDHQLPGLSGFDLCLKLVEQRPAFALVLLTGVGSEQMAIKALRAGINDYIVKDASREYLDLLPLVLPKVARRHRQRRHQELAARLRGTEPDSQEGPVDMAISLAACAEAIQQKGGRVWLESADPAHPTLHLSVPLAPDEAAFWAAPAESQTRSTADGPPRAASSAASHPTESASEAEKSSSAEPAESGPELTDHAARHVLVVHPNPIVTFVARRTAERSGCRVATAVNGLKAIEALEREPFDLVLIALEMPDLDGLETARRIRGGGSGDLRILALGTRADTEQRWRDAGMDGAVEVPVSDASLRAAIGDGWVDRRAADEGFAV